MAIKSKSESYKEKININSYRTRIKHLNPQRLKGIKGIKSSDKAKKINYVTRKIKPGYSKYKRPVINHATNGQLNNRIRSQTLVGNMSSNIKDTFRGDESNEPDVGIQSVLYSTDKIDKAADIVYSSKRVIHTVKSAKSIINKNKEKGSIDKTYLLKQLSKKGIRSGLVSAKNINSQMSNQFQSEDTDLGIRSFAVAEKEVRRAYDTISAVKNTSNDITNIIKTVHAKKARHNNFIKNKIYSENTKRYNSYKEKINNAKYNNKSKQPIKTSSSKTLFKRSSNVKINSAAINNTIRNKTTTKLAKNTFRIISKVANLILPAKKTMLILLAAMAVLFMVMASSSSVVSLMSQQYFFADEDVALQYKEKIELLDEDLKEKISDLRNDDSYDSSKVVYIGDMQGIYTNFQEIFAIATVEFEQDLTFSMKEKELIEEIYEEMYDIKISSEIYYVINGNGDKVSRIRKVITVYTNDMESIMKNLRFDDEQKSWTRRLVSNFTVQFPYLAQQYGELTQEEINNLILNAPKFSSRQQEELYETALSIVGKVKYFWGGKSVSGWNDEWGELTLVTSPGNETTGEYKPLGLDCSGYVDWVYKTAGIGNMLSRGGTAYQWGQSYPISSDELQIGDLAFLQMPNSSGINHVGIYIGKDDDNNNLYAHCQWGTGVTVDGYKGFKYFRRVVEFD